VPFLTFHASGGTSLSVFVAALFAFRPPGFPFALALGPSREPFFDALLVAFAV
jgi:hypothetical protein